ncbi:glycine zipper 2TM domain-containing protein [Pseudodesulfovibrio cashew]|uniref:Glycine zipper 2TM domain-containing protein n=1 Tax=Pseudodesulfovibrio cashew TaxID=2678688 RepID=A0A6I6JK27_9BACT|nr:glycine zipper domain-containing protein [Pseudodesulfovibrio cashew]QGY40662.1 glycine zipper 2TM domain-containing protein [Pseudodesulfovibrio cashew]
MKRYITPLILACFLVAGFGCAANKAQQGATVGGLAGATIGALTFKDKLLGAAVGAGVGVLMGYIVGNEWDKSDEQKLQYSMEHNKSGQTTSWTNPDTGEAYAATPGHPYVSESKVYRDVIIKDKDGREVMAKAWRDDKGVWHLKQ